MTDLSSAISALFQAVPELAAFFRNREAWLVGGAVRDLLMGLRPIDYDIVVRQDPEILAGDISRDTGASFFKMGKNRQVVFRGRLKDHTIDIVPMAGDSIESDLRLRDFTINAMAVHLGSRAFLDPVGGRHDLASRTLRMVSDKAFPSDPLRMLRAYRFAATLNFEIEKGTESAIKAHSRLICRPAGERIREELIRLLAAPGATGYLWKMKDSGLLFDLFPELVDEKGCMQNRHHCFDVLDHTLFACRHLESLLNDPGTETDPALQPAIDGIDDRLKPVLKLAMLLHDIGKPRTRSMDTGGSVHFFGHEKIGAGLAEAISGRLKFSNLDADYLCGLIQNHLAAGFVVPGAPESVADPKRNRSAFQVPEYPYARDPDDGAGGHPCKDGTGLRCGSVIFWFYRGSAENLFSGLSAGNKQSTADHGPGSDRIVRAAAVTGIQNHSGGC